MSATAIVWFRRDLRLFDHAALHKALRNSQRVIAVFIFDSTILQTLPKRDPRLAFIWHSLQQLKTSLREQGSDLLVRYGDPCREIPALAQQYRAAAVYANNDYEPEAICRDAGVAQQLAAQGIGFHSYKDQVIFEKDEILTQAQGMYSVFTPYKRVWLAKVDDFYLRSYPVLPYLNNLARLTEPELPPLSELGFEDCNVDLYKPGMQGGEMLFEDFCQRIGQYHQARDFPAIKGVSYLSVHLRFGTVSIRELARVAWHTGGIGAQTWLSELIWRDFYQQILWHRPEVVTQVFKPSYNTIVFPNNPAYFAAWCQGRTGFPIVDAAMRQLNQTGYMHNRLRMIAASFLVKDLLIDWRWGERYFAEKLMDFDLASNNGGWQWAASTGCDAQPYFRIFNPVTQSERFDPEGKFIRRYCPELAQLSNKAIYAPWLDKTISGLTTEYPAPIVDHATQRLLALALFKRAITEVSN
ncbi:deoxyribodipyrimidine photo-lyase type I [Collimonas sp. OK607]|uniref:cryptochrome/photolyase family protein n=1 Tax=Collimonas sp. OK607 TaxID=1798194 RepID=UPI0008E5BFED|nr:deoxyribodipyrimidine photo-lyase [Collimonas sp. OK607]SFB03858.1 deoxyribodipyrimidine photo-lyase type I [Collimonas sp. OK607]